MTDLRLHNSDLDLMISPSNGGGIVSFEGFGEPVLMSAPDQIVAPTDPAAFVLLPYCNRIAHGRARFAEQTLKLTPPFAGEPHALHGEGWVSQWKVKARDEVSAELSHRHEPTDGTWPWAFETTQHYGLSANRLVHRLEIQNKSEFPMPAGLGFHPYFPRKPGDGFRAQVGGRWNIAEDMLPEDHGVGGPADYWPQSQLPVDVPLDHCFTSWDGELMISSENIRVSLTASEELGLLHVYAPSGADFFCAEPVSHMPNALNRPGEPNQMHVLQPGDTFKASVCYLVEKPA